MDDSALCEEMQVPHQVPQQVPHQVQYQVIAPGPCFAPLYAVKCNAPAQFPDLGRLGQAIGK